MSAPVSLVPRSDTHLQVLHSLSLRATSKTTRNSGVEPWKYGWGTAVCALGFYLYLGFRSLYFGQYLEYNLGMSG